MTFKDVQHRITLSNRHRTALKRHAVTAEPYESCALLFGRDERVLDLFTTENVSAERTRFFTISAEELIAGYREAAGRGLEVVGIFHSHPTSEAYPSATDMRYMQSNPVVWIIYSGHTGEFRGYALDDDNDDNDGTVLEVLVESGPD